MTAGPDRDAAAARMRRVEELYHQMLSHPVDLRSSALAAACAGDRELAAEVQALLDQPESEAGPFATPAMELAARAVSAAAPSLVGRRIGVFEVQGLLGVGGMGEVYRGRDTRLGRAVAIKLLPRLFRDDPDREARFEREAHVLASLNHPNIAAVYGLEETEGVKALIMELVEGEDLSLRVVRGAMPLKEALPVARQIAEAIDAAHERGIIHRDLKPANIKVRPDGTVKVLDFGLAKALETGSASEADPTESPTMTARATKVGMILGTPAYMSPEQARGAPVDRRTDVWAFGCVLYEMLTGHPVFSRETTSDTIAAIIEREVDWSRLPRDTPAAVTRVLRRCLEKDPRRRLRDIADTRAELDDLEPAAPSDEGSRSRAGAWPRWKAAALVAGGLSLVATAFGAWSWLRGKGPPNAGPIAFDVALPAGVRLIGTPVLSNDGRQLAFVGEHGATRGIYLRQLDSPVVRLVEGTDGPGNEGGMYPFFSTTGDRLAFFASDSLKVTRLDGGKPSALCPAPGARGGAWRDDDVIVFAAGVTSGLSQVKASGGSAEPLTTLARGETSHRWPLSMPGASSLVFVTQFQDGGSAIMAMSRADTGHRRLIDRATAPRYAEGFLFYVNEDEEFMAAPIDARTLTLLGPGIPQPERFNQGSNRSDFAYGVSRSGAMAFSPFSAAERSLVIVEPGGGQHAIPGTARPFGEPRVSPDGRKIAVTITPKTRWGDVWVGDLSGSFLPLTRDGESRGPVWSARGDAVVVESSRSGFASGVFVHSIDGRQARPFFPDRANPFFLAPASWPSDDTMVFVAYNMPSRPQVALQWIAPPKTVPERVPLAVSQSAWGRVSPDGKWLAYTTRESGQYEVYVTDFPGARRIWPVSKAGSGRETVWAKAGRDLFFLREDGSVMATTVGPDGQPSEPRSAGVGRFPVSPANPGSPWWDTLPGGRFIVTQTITSPPAPSIAVVVNRAARLASK